MKILIIDDERICRSLLTRVLAKGGHDVVETVNGAEAWQVLQQPNAPRLVILDWMMPEMDGLEVLRRVRSQPTHCPPYIVMLTSRGANADILTGLSAGANDYLTKPAEPAELLSRVEVGRRTIDMQLRHCRRLQRAQIVRVDAGRRLAELQDKWVFTNAERLRTRADRCTVKARLQSAW
jgi:DNA-binding response OmpR family regulator